MMKKFDVRILLVAILSVVLMGFVVACDSEYDNPQEDAKASYYSSELPFVNPEQLQTWINNGYKTEDGRQVVVLDATQVAHANYIPGAVQPPMLDDFPGGQGWGMSRTDGVLTSVSNEVYDGATMDSILQYAGIDMDTVVVLTNNNWTLTNPNNQITRAYWNFWYWGFSTANVKMLNGGNAGYATLAGVTMQATPSNPSKMTTFSVKDLPDNRIDLARAPYGEVYERAMDGSALIINTMGTSTFYADGTPYVSAGLFDGKIRGSKLLYNGNSNYPQMLDTTFTQYGRFDNPDSDNLFMFADVLTPTENMLPSNKNARIIVHCGSGQSTSPFWFYLTFVLGYTNVAIYDGSTGEWYAATMYRYDGTTPANYLRTSTPREWINWNGSKFVDQNGTDATAIIPAYNFKFDAAKASDNVSFPATTWNGTTSVDLTYDGNGRGINEEDKGYVNQGRSSGDDGAFSGGSGGGAPAVGGC